MKAKTKRILNKTWWWTKKILLWGFISSLLYLIICRWVMPPVTVTQVANSFGYGLKRDYVPWDEISYNIKLAAIASEDQLFPDHNGFDWDAIDKSFKPKKNKKSKIPPGGGASTISQQCAKNVFLWQGDGWLSKRIRKAGEFYFTQMIEWVWGKKRILEVYLNVIEMGPGIFGVEAAARTYFNKSAKNLSRQEAAMIIACLPNPKRFTVKPVSPRVGSRYPWIMRQMTNIEDDEDVQAIIKNKVNTAKKK